MKKRYANLEEIIADCERAGFTSYHLNSDEEGYYVTSAGIGITAGEYQRKAEHFIRHELTREQKLSNAAMGLCGEAGEVCDLLKKHLYQGHKLDMDKVREELGDVAWYIAFVATALNIPLTDVLCGNIDKLSRRYPEGFSEERSINREA